MVGKKVAVITGASRGIGKNMALYFAENDYIVIATGRNKDNLMKLEEEIKQFSPRSKTCVMDVTNPAEIAEVVETVKEEFEHIDVWVNNAGAFMAIGPTWEVNEKDWVSDVQTNLFGTFYCVQAVVPVMLEQNSGRVINVVGGGTIGTFEYGNGYGTSKTAIARLTENLAAELSETPIKTFALDPGLNDTDMTRYQREAEVGKQYLSGIESLFEQNIDVPPHQAPSWAYKLASGDYDVLSGRIISVYDDVDEFGRLAEEDETGDFLKLRLRK